MAVQVSNILIRRLVTEKSGVAPGTVALVMDAYAVVMEHLLESGAKVRVAELGYLEVVKTKPTRRRLPGQQELIDVPEREKIVFRPAVPPK